jgi:nitroreductase
VSLATAGASTIGTTIVDPATVDPATTRDGVLQPLLADRHGACAFDPRAALDAHQLDLLLEAARWAPSTSNTQPWRFLAGRRGDRAFTALLAALTPANRRWARDAAALVLVAAETAGPDGIPRHWALYDTGQATAHLTTEASALGFAARQIVGFLPSNLPDLPERITPLVVVAIGVPLAREAVPADHPAQRIAASTRRPLDELLLDVA